MTQSRPTLRRRMLTRLAPFLLAIAALPLMAPTCGTLAPGVKTFSRNSIIIPMDVCYQSMSDDLHKDSTGTGYTPSSCPQAKATGDVIRAYGLVYQLIRNNIAVYWVINPQKASVTDVDMSVQYNGGPPVLSYSWTAGGVSTTAPTSGSKIDYRGGPFVIDGSDFAAASAVLQTYKATFSGVNLHVSNVAFQGNVAKTMAGGWSAGGAIAPKLALLNIGSDGAGAKNAEPVIQGYLTRAGLDTAGAAGTATDTGHGQIYDTLLMSDFLPSVPGDWTTSNLYKYGYQILWVPHWAAPSSCSDCTGFKSTTCPCKNKYSATTIAAALATMGSFSKAGHDVFAECAGLGSFDGVFANTGTTSSFNGTYGAGGTTTHFETAAPTGFWINAWPSGNPNTDGAILRTGFSSPLMQIGDFPFVVTSGAIEDYRSSAYQAGVIQFISDNTDQRYDVFTMQPSAGSRGTVVYLSGHSYSGTDGSFEVAGSRLVLNTLFNLGASCVETGVACDTGLLGECAKGVMSCQNGQPYCREVNFPQAEICDGKDNDCNGLVDDGLDVGCYDGPAGTAGVGTCHNGVSSCIEKADGSYGMSACVGEQLPADEVCNGLDDNCNGKVDESPVNPSQPLSTTCYTGPSSSLDPTSGLPRGICKQGLATCTNGTWSDCTVCPTNAWQDPGNAAYAGCEILPEIQLCEGPGMNLDMTCSGTITCSCTNGATQSCYDGPPGTVGVGICKAGIRTCSNGSWGECSGEQTPLPLDCTSTTVDNTCDGRIDSQDPSCKTCPPPTDPSRICKVPNITRNADGSPTGICVDGVRSCTNGVLGDCKGEVLPFPEVCDGKDNNCNGQVDENPDTLCTSGFTCVSGVCVPASCGVEDLCPEGFKCQLASNSSLGTCVRDPNGCGPSKTVCSAGETCTNGTCTDPCQGVTCGQGNVCASGACTGGGCYMSGCPTGQICQEGSCVANPCLGNSCPQGTFCRNGDCVQSCVYSSCSTGQKCSQDGFCENDPCANVPCQPGQICSAGTCQDDPCEGLGCGSGQTCVDGACQDDPCDVVSCPVGACSQGQCYPVTTPSSAKGVTHNSSSGCGCGNGGDSGSLLAALLFLLFVPLVRRRFRPQEASAGHRDRLRRGAGKGFLLLLLALVALSACGKSNSSVDLSACKATCGEQSCVDLNYDASHCGTCDTACSSDQICVDGVCGPSSAVAPFVDTVSPSQANFGLLTPATVSLTGVRFAQGATLRAISTSGTATFSTTFVDASHLTAQLDLSETPITQLELQVVNPGKVISNTVGFDVVSAAPSLVSVTPSSVNTGSVTTLDVKGSGFSSSSLCHLSSTSFAEEALPSVGDGTGGLSCTFDATSAPPAAYDLWVVNDGTLASNHLQLQVTSATPVLSALSPSSAQSGTITAVTLLGQGFDVTSAAYFGSSPQFTSYVDPTHLLVPQYSVGTSTVTVTVKNGSSGTASNGLPFVAIPNPPLANNLSVIPSPLYQGKARPSPSAAPTSPR